MKSRNILLISTDVTRHRKCDEAKPRCNNCVSTNRTCEGYGIRLSFDVDDSRNHERFDNKGVFKHSFIGRPRAKRKADGDQRMKVSESTRLQSGQWSASSQHSGAVSNEPAGFPILQTELHQQESSQLLGSVKSLLGFMDEVIQASSIDMEEVPQLINNHAGTNLKNFGTELFEGLEYLLKSPTAQQVPFDNVKSKNSQSLNFILESPSLFAEQNSDTKNENGKATRTNSWVTPSFAHPTLSSSSLMADVLTNSGAEGSMHPPYSGTKVFDRNYPVNNSTSTEDSSLTYSEENMMLKHFFKNLLPLLDAHPNSPWPDLALKYCDFEIARSCFISLSCIHIYESRKGGKEYYKKGMAHINRTMDYLIQFISSNDSQEDVSVDNPNEDHNSTQKKNDGDTHIDDRMISFVHADTEKDCEGSTNSTVNNTTRKKMISSFVILVLINVHILFAVLEKGLSSFSRFFFEVFASVCLDSRFYDSLKENAKKQSLVVVLSWYDTVSAIVSADYRRPYCNPDWYGSSVNKSDKVSTAKMMGCPGEIFRAMSEVCLLRHEIHKGVQIQKEELVARYQAIESSIIRYREYVVLEPSYDEGETIDNEGQAYAIRLKAAQCWLLAVYITLIKTVKYPFFEEKIKSLLHEFIDVYGSMKPTLPFITQMVWPVFAMGCECTTSWEKSKLELFMDTLYRNAQMGTLFTLRQIVFRVWETKESPEQIIKAYLDESIDYLPL